MKKSELKQLLRIIAEEVVSAKKARLNETKGLSGFKKAKESTEHTENVADSKSLTPTSEPKEQKEGKKLPVVKKPANPQKVGNIKEEILQMIREEISEMSRAKGSVGTKFKVRDSSSPTGWVVKGHPTIPDGTEIEAPKGPYVPKGENPNMGRPKKSQTPSIDDMADDDDDDTSDDEAPPEQYSGVDAGNKIKVNVDGEDVGEINLAELKGSTMGALRSVLRRVNVTLPLNPKIQEKLDIMNDLYADDKLPRNASIDLKVNFDTDTVELDS
jgi:hypothetical protein